MEVLILAGGYGTRLYPLVTDTPKPLLKINDKKSLIDFTLDKVYPLEGLTRIYVVTNNKFYDNFVEWEKTLKDKPCPIKIINDGTNTPEDRLGSIGDIHFVIKNENIQDDLVVIGGDNLFDYELKDFIQFAGKSKPYVTVGLYDIKDISQATKFGVVGLGNDTISSFEEKPKEPRSSLIAMCLYYFPREMLASVGEYLNETKKADKAGEYIQWLFQKTDVYGFTFQGQWYDIGSIESYRAAQEAFKNQ